MEVEIVLFKEPKRGIFARGDKFFLTGFHGVGVVGYFTSLYIAEQKDSNFIGYIKLDKMPLMVKMRADRIGLPLEFYERGDFVILLNETLPSADQVHTLIEKISNWVVSSGFKEAVLIGGLLKKFVQDEEVPFRVAYTSAYLDKGRLKKEIAEGGLPRIDSNLQIYGPLALMLAHFELMKFPAIAILPLSTHRYELDVEAVHVALKFLNEHYNAKIDLSEIESITESIGKMKKQIEEEMKKEEEEILRRAKREDFMFYM